MFKLELDSQLGLAEVVFDNKEWNSNEELHNALLNNGMEHILGNTIKFKTPGSNYCGIGNDISYMTTFENIANEHINNISIPFDEAYKMISANKKQVIVNCKNQKVRVISIINIDGIVYAASDYEKPIFRLYKTETGNLRLSSIVYKNDFYRYSDALKDGFKNVSFSNDSSKLMFENPEEFMAFLNNKNSTLLL